jgi:hypothetical protein
MGVPALQNAIDILAVHVPVRKAINQPPTKTMTTPRKKAAPRKGSTPAPVATQVDNSAKRQEIEMRLHAIAGKPEHADEFERLRLELAAL